MKRRSNLWAFGGAWLVAAIFLFFAAHRLYFAARGHAETVVSVVMYPIMKLSSWTVQPVRSWYDSRRSHEELIQQVQQLEDSCHALRAQNIALSQSLAFVQETQELQAFRQRYEDPGIIAQIIFKNISPEGHFFLVDAGSRAGVQPGSVAVYKNVLVGRVTDVYPFYSRVLLVTDRCCKVAAFLTQTQAQGVYSGRNDVAQACLEHVSHLVSVAVGDTLISSGEGTVFPRGFLVGTVTSCATHGFVYDVAVKPALDATQLAYVCLMHKGVGQDLLSAATSGR